MNDKQQLSLLVINSEHLEGNSQVQHQFGPEGGTFGSSDSCDWPLNDRLNTVMPEHARIEVIDDKFCLCDISGQTFINGSTSPMGPGRKVILEDSDELNIGPFRIRVFIGEVKTEPQLTQLLGKHESKSIDGWLKEDIPTFSSQTSASEQTEAQAISDPLRVLQQERNSVASMLNTPAPADMLPQLNVGVGSRDTLDQDFIELPGAQNFNPSFNPSAEASLSSLMQGLGQTLPQKNPLQTQEMLHELGKTVRVMVEGLLTLQAEQAALADKLLRPIEDNPLRLGLDYDSTLALLFAEAKSPVHLSAPSAVQEVLRNVRIHNDANQRAISTALESLLQALSPEVLLARFNQYRRGACAMHEENSWAWEMYQHYFRELNSSRQQGFHKLFQQVYAQAYDRAVREQQDQA
ncbi:type VI secretion protein [Pluralibacter gergoviae]|uniref:type VI secretion system-associated FHA domain protein TagH n=1 Tax=Pluralibacter gergoviae TaxID=61647 RepID=UPI0004F589D7|nr:type VI secretion protein [Pluralibacter gergoviae]